MKMLKRQNAQMKRWEHSDICLFQRATTYILTVARRRLKTNREPLKRVNVLIKMSLLTDVCACVCVCVCVYIYVQVLEPVKVQVLEHDQIPENKHIRVPEHEHSQIPEPEYDQVPENI